MNGQPVTGIGFLIYVIDPVSQEEKVIASQKDCTLNRSRNQIDASDKTTGEWERSLAGLKSWNLAFDNLLIEGDDGQEILEDAFAGNGLVNVVLKTPGGNKYVGLASITELSLALPDNDVAKNSGTLSGAGPLTFVRGFQLSMTVNNVLYGVTDGAGDYYEEEEVTISATPFSGYGFKEWTGTGITHFAETYDAESNPAVVDMPSENIAFEAVFEIAYDLNVVSADEAEGTVTGDGQYVAGKVIEVVATPESSKQFVEWTGSGVAHITTGTSTDATIEVTMPSEDISLIATFADL